MPHSSTRSSKSRASEAPRRLAGSSPTTLTTREIDGDSGARTSPCRYITRLISIAHTAYRFAPHAWRRSHVESPSTGDEAKRCSLERFRGESLPTVSKTQWIAATRCGRPRPPFEPASCTAAWTKVRPRHTDAFPRRGPEIRRWEGAKGEASRAVARRGQRHAKQTSGRVVPGCTRSGS